MCIRGRHTNFDIAFDGLNDYFMEVMGFEDTKILDVTNSETLYKVAVYVPKTHELQVRKVLGDAGAGYIGNYSNCTFNINGIGTFKPCLLYTSINIIIVLMNNNAIILTIK